MEPYATRSRAHTHTHVHAYSLNSHTHCLFIEPPHGPHCSILSRKASIYKPQCSQDATSKAPHLQKTKPLQSVLAVHMCLCAYYYCDVMLGMLCVFQSQRLYRDNSHHVEFVSLSLSPKTGHVSVCTCLEVLARGKPPSGNSG